ncbi:uncharacterized protein LOC114529306 [Dendronephthya gigantea]|uniref:uncharacterized protein LOC114529306 n=1 Tax=Dendronephthya gigantea TaxID=151771 RepID=UPI00106C8C6E|nr:uncharacterized protein LOC114529306 [Dendronephthya gigantea]
MFSVDDIVWAKSSLAREIFWPAKVIEPDHDLDNQSRKPTIAYVNYFAENTVDAIKNASNVKAFECERKEAFMKKGRRLKMQGKRLLFESAIREAETLIKLHDKSKFKVGRRKRKRNTLPTIAEELNTSLDNKDSSSIKQNETAQNESCNFARKTRSPFKKIKPKTNPCEKELLVKSEEHFGEIRSKRRRNRSDKPSLNEFEDTVESENLDRPRRRKNSASKVNEQEMAGNSSQETKLNVKRKRRTYQRTVSTENTVCKASYRRRTRSKSKAGSLRRSSPRKLSGSKSDSDCFVGENDIGNVRNDKLDTIVEECVDNLDDTISKIARNSEGTGESFENEDTELEKEIKRPRTTILKEEKQNLNTDICEGDSTEPISGGLKTLNSSSNVLDIQNRLLYHKDNDEDIEATQSSTHTETSLQPVDNSLNGLNDSACCDSSSALLATQSVSDSLVASETADEFSGCNNNEKGLENLGPKDESENGNNSDNEDNASNDCSSDDDSLPEAFSPAPATKNFKRGDVVWAKHMKFPPWPAQVGKSPCTKQKTHYNIIFLPKSGEKGIKILKKNVQSFSQDQETFLRLKNQEIQSHLIEDFNRAVEQAEEILLRRVFQKDDIPMDDMLEDEASDSSDDDDDGVSKLEQEKSVDPVCKPVSESEQPVEKSEEDESGFDSSEMDAQSEENACHERKREHVSRYGNVLNELHLCKQRLLAVYREEVPSFRHKTFKYGRVSERDALKHKGGFGPIQDEQTGEEIVRVLKMWLDAEAKQSYVTLDYVFEVWLPEAMIYYIQHIDNISAEQAEEIYLDHARNVDKRDVKEASNLFKMKKIDQETMMRTVERAKQKLLYGGP